MVAAIGASRASRWRGEGDGRKWIGSGLPEEDLESFTEHGLQPAIVNGTAGGKRSCLTRDPYPSHRSLRQPRARLTIRLILFDTALFHAGCPAEDPTGAGPRSHGPEHLLRAICVMAMAPTRLLTPGLIPARVRAYELDQFIGGTVSKLYFEGEDCILPNYVEENCDTPSVRSFDEAPE
eukprot:SAG31_NODE_10996_length_1075_cov_0.922131_3_plen_178_part_01